MSLIKVIITEELKKEGYDTKAIDNKYILKTGQKLQDIPMVTPEMLKELKKEQNITNSKKNEPA